MGFIYIITNDITNKNYIGQTIRTIEERWKDHATEYKNPTRQNHLYRSMRKYGVEHFHIKTLEEVDNDLLNEREMYWVQYYDSYHNGYNDTLGGEGRITINREEALQAWNEHTDWTVKDLADFIGCCNTRMTRILNELDISNEERIGRSALKRRKINGQTILQYDFDGNFIDEFESSKDAEEATGAMQDEINRCCKRARNAYSANGYIWKRANDETPIEVWVEANKKKMGRRAVLQYTTENVFIKEYSSIIEAAKAYGHISSGSISNCCSGKQKTAYGFIWKYKEDKE